MIQKLGKYVIVEKLGEGAMGAVYKGYDEILDRYVAIKTMVEDIQWNAELKLRFYREARSAASLHHPNIVVIHDMGEEGKMAYIVMEFLDGKDLKDLIKDKSPLPMEQKISICAQVCEGLNHAHLAGIIHRDIKPGNIHFSSTGTVKIVDFGIAHIPSSDLTQSGVRLGTPIYMSPEQIRGESYDEHSDMFSAGIVFYELLTYVHPFRDKNVTKTLDNILFQNHFPFAEQCPEAPPGLWPVLRTCLEKETGKRYRTMAEAGRAFRNLLVDLDAASLKIAGELSQAKIEASQQVEEKKQSRIAARLDEARRALASRQYPSAIEALNEILQADPGHAEAAELRRQALAEAAELRRQALAEAEAERAQAARKAAEITNLLGRGRAALQRWEFDAADAHARKILELDPDNAGAHELLKSIDLAREAKRKQDQIDSELARGREALEKQDFAAAAACCNSVLTIDPGNSSARNLLLAIKQAEERKLREEQIGQFLAQGQQAFQQDDLMEAGQLARRALEVDSQHARAKEFLATIEDARQKRRKAEIEELVARGREALEKQDFAAAAACCNSVLTIDPGNSSARNLLLAIKQAEERKLREEQIGQFLAQGQQAFQQDDLTEAGQLARRALEVDPQHARAKEFLATIEDARQKRRKAEIEELVARGREALEKQDFAAAAACCNSVLTIDPGNSSARNLLLAIKQAEERKLREEQIGRFLAQGQQAFQQDDLMEAEKLARRALEVDSQHAGAREFLAAINEARQRRRKAEIEELVTRGRQALGHGKFSEAIDLGRQALALDQENAEARNLLDVVEQAKENLQQEEIAAALECGRNALERGDFDEAARQAEVALNLEAKNEAAGILLKETRQKRKNHAKMEAEEKKRLEKEKKRLEKEKTRLEKEERRREKEEKISAAAENMDATVALDHAGSAGKARSRGGWKVILWICVAAAIVVGAVVLGRHYRFSKRPLEIPAQLSSAQASFDGGHYDEAIAAAQSVLDASPGNTQALSLIDSARRQKTQKEISTLLMEAQSLRSQGKLPESMNTLAKLLSIDPANEAGLSVRVQIESEIAATKSSEEQDAAAKSWLANAGTLLAAGKLAEAKAELDKASRIRPDMPELKALRKQLTSRSEEVARLDKLDKQKLDASQKQKMVDELGGQAEILFEQAKYNEAAKTIDQWLASAPQNTRAQMLQRQTQQALQSLKAFETHITDRQYDEALAAVAQLEKINPADPGIGELRRRVEDRRAAARAMISIYRLGRPCKLILDGTPVGTDGEVENKSIGVGRHKLVIENSAGKQAGNNPDFAEGQTAAFVYDAATMELRPMADTDRALLIKRRALEQIYSCEVEHRHLLGKCTGTLLISGFKVEYRASDKSHSFEKPFSSLKLSVKSGDDKIEMNIIEGTSGSSGSSWTFKVRNSAQAAEIKELWDRLQKLIK